MEFQFTLRFDLGAELAASDVLVERLWKAGCDDAIVGLGCPGRIALVFGREAPTRNKAIDSALRDVASALPSAKLLEIQ